MPNLSQTPTGERVQIAIFGRTNVGKSALINALTGQELAIVSPVSGTTTDPVSNSMELLPLGPVTLIDLKFGSPVPGNSPCAPKMKMPALALAPRMEISLSGESIAPPNQKWLPFATYVPPSTDVPLK